MSAGSTLMELKVSKWGNSLAVRLPAEVGRRIRVGAGDTLIAEIDSDGRLMLAPKGRAVSTAAIRRLRRALAEQKETLPIVARMRRTDRY
jgi:antitoxin MazE